MSRIDSFQAETSSKLSHLQAIYEVGKFILSTGPIVVTHKAAEIYMHAKGLTNGKLSSEFYEMVSKYLNIIQIYISGKAYLVQNTGSNIETIVSTVNNDVIVNERVSERLNDIFKTSLQYLDSPRDRQVVKGLLAEITSVRFTTALQGIKSREGTKTH